MSEVTIILDGKDEASKELDDVIGRLDHLDGKSKDTDASMQGVSKSSGQAGKGLKGMASKATMAAGAFVAFEVVKGILTGIKDGVVELNTALGEFQEPAARLDNLVLLMSESSNQATKQLEGMDKAIEHMSQRTGKSIPTLTRMMSEMTLRFGDAEIAAENFERANNIVAATGRDGADVAKSLSEALGGQFGALREAGVLTVEQAESLSQMEDSGLAAAEAMRIVDSNVAGFVDTTPLAIEASDRLATANQRLKASFAELLNVDQIMDTAARGMEAVTGQVDAFVTAWEEAPGSISAAMREIDRDFKTQADSIRSTSQDLSDAVAQQTIAGIENETQTRINFLRERIEEEGSLVIERGRTRDLNAEINELRRIEAERIMLIRNRANLHQREDFDAREERNKQLELELELSESTNETERAALQNRIALQELDANRREALREIQDENGRILDTEAEKTINLEYQLGVSQLIRKQEEEKGEVQVETNEAVAEESRLRTLALEMRTLALQTSNKERAATLEFQARLAEINDQDLSQAERRLELQRAHNQLSQTLADITRASIEENSRAIDDVIRTSESYLREGQATLSSFESRRGGPTESATSVIAEHSARDRATIEENSRAISDAIRSIGDTQRETSSMIRGLGEEESRVLTDNISRLEEQKAVMEESGQDTAFMDRRIDALREENDLLIENNRLQQERFAALGATADQLGVLASSLGEVAKAEWDFEEASSSVVAAQQALSGAVSGALDAAGVGIKEKAKWMAAFEGAQAVASLGLALAFPSPNYWAAVANHTTAAAQFGLIAGGVIGSGASSAGSGGGGGGGVQTPSVNRDQIMNEAMRFQDGTGSSSSGRGETTINVNFGSNNTYLEESPTTQRRIVDGLMVELPNLLDVG